MAEVDLTTKLKSFPKIKTVTVTEEGFVKLTWSKVALAEKYDIKRSESPSGPFTHIEWAKKPEFTDETVERDTTYWYKVIAWKRMEGKKTSTKASAVKPVVVSDIPAVENLTAVTKDSRIRLSWDKADADTFFVYRRSDHFSRPVYIGKTDKADFTDENPVSGQAYHYTVQCAKKGEEKLLHGNFSKEADGVFLDSTEILSVKKSLGKILNIGVRIVAGSDGYILEKSNSKDGEYKEVARSEDITGVFFEHKLTSRFGTAYYRVCAYKMIGEKEFRGGYSAQTAAKG
ncbi:MAG: hypothetical protein E7544_02505 [Ruminococcaceae bacterium]|nr:hypothetical protein [Oscillospiraceae bacterium]